MKKQDPHAWYGRLDVQSTFLLVNLGAAAYIMSGDVDGSPKIVPRRRPTGGEKVEDSHH